MSLNTKLPTKMLVTLVKASYGYRIIEPISKMYQFETQAKMSIRSAFSKN